jgi:DNA-binding GntR family transcriptional regulator
MGTDPEPAIETRSFSEQAYKYLCDRIIEGAINYGDTINIKLLAEELSVSPMPIREAVKRLEIEGVITIKPRSTCFLKIPTRESILSALELRELIEIHCVETVFSRVRAQELETFAEIIQAMEPIACGKQGPKHIKEYVKLDCRFHTELCRLASNEFIDKFYREVSLHLTMKYIYEIGVPPDIVGTFRDHREIVETLRKNSIQAVSLIKKHLQRSRENVLNGGLL